MLWTWYFSQQPEGQRLWTSLYFQMLQVATNIGIHHRPFCGDNFNSKNFEKLSLVESLFNITQDYSLHPRTLINPVTDDSIKCLNSSAENFGKYQRNVCSGVPFYYSCTNTVYSLPADRRLHYRYILKVLGKERIF